MNQTSASPYVVLHVLARLMLCIALAFMCVPFVTIQALADEPLFRTVRVGYLNNTLGYEEGSSGTYMSGWGYEYLQTLSYYTSNWTYEYVDGNFSELLAKLEAGEIDLMANISYTEERAQKLLFSTNPQGTERYYIYAKSNNDELSSGNYKKLKGCKVGCVKGLLQTEVGKQWLAKKGIDVTYVEFDGSDSLYKALSEGQIDALIMNDTMSNDEALPLFCVGESKYYFAVPKSCQDLMDQINTAMTQIQSANPRYNDEIKTRYAVTNGGSSALTGQEQSWLQSHSNTITLGYLQSVLPYSAQDAGGKLEGALAVLVDALEENYGIQVDTKAYSSNNDMRHALEQGEVDVVAPVCKDYWTAEQGHYVQSSTLATSSILAIHNAFGSMEENLSSIAYHSSSLFNKDVLAARYPDADLLECRDIAACVDAVRTGKAKCVLLPTTALSAMSEVIDTSDLKTTELSQSMELCCWLGKGSPQLLSILNKAIVFASDNIDAATFSHYSYYANESGIQRFVRENASTLLMLFVAFLLLVIVVLVWSLRRARKAQAIAVEANAAKTRFLSRMSHDIRTPLNGIIGLIDVNNLHPGDAEPNTQNRAKAKVAASHLLALMSDVLEMSKLEDRDVKIVPEPFNLMEILSELHTLETLRAQEFGVTLTTDGAHSLPYYDLIGSPVYVRRVFVNLMDNAIKYNKRGGSVECSASMVSKQGDKVTYRFVFADTGIGMSEKFMEELFEPFTQASDDARSNFQGTGLGLPIVKALVEKMSGTIEVSSVLGQGSTFVVTLPFIIDPEPCKRLEAAEQKACSIEGLNLLVAEDNELNQEIVTTLLTEAGAHVVCVEDGQAAVEMFESKPAGSFDAIIMDIMMPRMDGLQATKAIRLGSRRDGGSIPIIAMSANAFMEDVLACRRVGMNDHLAKPIDIEQVKRTLVKYLR